MTQAMPPGAPWTVNSSNGYCCDLIGEDPGLASYYSGVIADKTAPYTSCTVDVLQTLSINVCGSSTAYTQYGMPQHTTNTITATGMNAVRGSGPNATASGPIQYQGGQ